MRTLLACYLLLFTAVVSMGKIPMAFLGIQDLEEPLLKSELERLIYRELRSQPRYNLLPAPQIRLSMEKGVFHGPEVGTKPSVKLAKDLNTRILSFGVLKKMELNWRRKWYKPWKGDAVFTHSMWLKVIDGKNGEMKFSGLIEASEVVENIYLGPEPTVGTMDPVIRDMSLLRLMEKLAVETKNRIEASLSGVKEEKEQSKKLFDPALFPDKAKVPADSTELESPESPEQTEVPIKPKTYVFPDKKKEKDSTIDESTMEKLENDQELLDDVNLLEGM